MLAGYITIGVVEDQSAGWYRTLQSYKLGSTVPVLRMMIQQSNCFVVVERGAAMQNMQMERQLQRSGEMREGSNMGAGQMVAADGQWNGQRIVSRDWLRRSTAPQSGLPGPADPAWRNIERAFTPQAAFYAWQWRVRPQPGAH